jgi:hypothetical protein
MRSGWIALAAAAIVLAALLGTGSPRGARLVILPIVWFGALGIFQARAST